MDVNASLHESQSLFPETEQFVPNIKLTFIPKQLHVLFKAKDYVRYYAYFSPPKLKF